MHLLKFFSNSFKSSKKYEAITHKKYVNFMLKTSGWFVVHKDEKETTVLHHNGNRIEEIINSQFLYNLLLFICETVTYNWPKNWNRIGLTRTDANKYGTDCHVFKFDNFTRYLRFHKCNRFCEWVWARQLSLDFIENQLQALVREKRQNFKKLDEMISRKVVW